jgi:DNA helicase-2/ATP-dependent DNA helicase PcrA
VTHRIGNPDTTADIQLRDLLDADARTCFVMVAGAGSGKTTSLIKALDHIAKRYGDELRRRLQKVACITYTEVAVGEIWSDVGNNPLFQVSTIHSFLWALVKPFQRDIAAWVKQRIEAKLAELHQTREAFGARTQQKTRDKNAYDTIRLTNHLEAVRHIRRFRYESGGDYSKGILGHDDIIKMVPQLVKDRTLLASLLAQRYPFFFVDESQDTFPDVVDALRTVARQNAGTFCLGFFGDSMQQIYAHGVGRIALEDGWREITKPENFRCPTTVLSVINNIRLQGDRLKQVRGRERSIDGVRQPVPGIAKLFILPADDERDKNLDRVRAWLASASSDDLWNSTSEAADMRILVIVHRMAATRLGFPELFAAFNDRAPESFKNGFREGDHWALKPFLGFLLPLSIAVACNRQFEVITFLRAHCPKLNREALKHIKNPTEVLKSLKKDVHRLSELMAKTGNVSVRDVLDFADRAQLIELDERFRDYLLAAPGENGQTTPESEPADHAEALNDDDKVAAAMISYMDCRAKELWGYREYINDKSPYSTQQGIKGAEFDRVIVVLDDEEGKHFQFSYEKLLGLKEPSKTDIQNQNEGKETVVDRTRRLFYVCCSRARGALAVVLYTSDVELTVDRLKSAGLFSELDIHSIDDISRGS